MSDDLTRRCRKYAAEVHSASSEEAWFFLGMNGKPVSARNAYHNFHRFLTQAGISHGGRGRGPRIHDFRHTFRCRCLRKWSEEGKDLNLEAYLREQRLTGPDKMDWPVFTGSRGNKLTREGVTYMISKYVAPAREKAPSIPEKVTPHMFRHSRAMTLLRAGVNLIYIRDFLGHTDVTGQ